MAQWMNLGQQVKVNARHYADKLALKDHARSFTYAETNRRVNQLAHGLMGLGLAKGDKIAVFMDNCIASLRSGSIRLPRSRCSGQSPRLPGTSGFSTPFPTQTRQADRKLHAVFPLMPNPKNA